MKNEVAQYRRKCVSTPHTNHQTEQPIPAKPTFAQLLAEYDLTPQHIARQSGVDESAVLVFVRQNQWFTTEIEQMIAALNALTDTQFTMDDLSIEYAHPRHLCKPPERLPYMV